MPRNGVQTLNDYRIAGLPALRIQCDKCGRSGQYSLDRAERLWGHNAGLPDILHALTKTCPRAQSGHNMLDRCAAIFLDSPYRV